MSGSSQTLHTIKGIEPIGKKKKYYVYEVCRPRNGA